MRLFIQPSTCDCPVPNLPTKPVVGVFLRNENTWIMLKAAFEAAQAEARKICEEGDDGKRCCEKVTIKVYCSTAAERWVEEYKPVPDEEKKFLCNNTIRTKGDFQNTFICSKE